MHRRGCRDQDEIPRQVQTEKALAGLIERDADITDGESLRIPSLFQLGERARLGSLEAKLELLVAAAALTGAEYSIDKWWVAYMDLQTEQAERRQEFRRRRKPAEWDHDAMRAAHEAADAEFLSEIDHAIRSWEERIALQDC